VLIERKVRAIEADASGTARAEGWCGGFRVDVETGARRVRRRHRRLLDPGIPAGPAAGTRRRTSRCPRAPRSTSSRSSRAPGWRAFADAPCPTYVRSLGR